VAVRTLLAVIGGVIMNIDGSIRALFISPVNDLWISLRTPTVDDDIEAQSQAIFLSNHKMQHNQPRNKPHSSVLPVRDRDIIHLTILKKPLSQNRSRPSETIHAKAFQVQYPF
jgi:hypothetical protein